jgi:hypothetical protein
LEAEPNLAAALPLADCLRLMAQDLSSYKDGGNMVQMCMPSGVGLESFMTVGAVLSKTHFLKPLKNKKQKTGARRSCMVCKRSKTGHKIVCRQCAGDPGGGFCGFWGFRGWQAAHTRRAGGAPMRARPECCGAPPVLMGFRVLRFIWGFRAS